jgi:NhaP-type Na+/H+ or K+/H+ antiporter
VSRVTETDLRFNLWFTITGALFVTLALSSTVLRRLPLTTAMLYLVVGVLIGPVGIGLLVLDPLDRSLLLERATELVVIISLFSAGLKLRSPLTDSRWRIPVRLAFVSMTLTVGAVTLVGIYGLGLPVGGAVLLGAILAPTDPVLASDVQVEDPRDQDRLRFGLTGEAGLNDGTAFPFVMLGLGLLGLHELGEVGWRWLAVDVLWAIPAGLAIGALLGTLCGDLIIHLRQEQRESVGADDFLALGLISLSYGPALLAHTYGFLAVFAAGVALRRVERLSTEEGAAREPDAAPTVHVDDAEQMATDAEHAPEFMARAVLGFSEQLERIGTVAVVILVGGMVAVLFPAADAVWFVPLLLLVIRPLSVTLGLLGSHTGEVRTGLISWFGIRGVGSIYYLMYAVEHGLPDELAARLTALVLTTVAVSIFVHGTSVTPLMKLYGRWTGRAETPGP